MFKCFYLHGCLMVINRYWISCHGEILLYLRVCIKHCHWASNMDIPISCCELHMFQVRLWPLLNFNSVEWIWKVLINLYQIVHRFVRNKHKDRFFFRPAANLKRVEDSVIYCKYISQCLLLFRWECAFNVLICLTVNKYDKGKL